MEDKIKEIIVDLWVAGQKMAPKRLADEAIQLLRDDYKLEFERFIRASDICLHCETVLLKRLMP